jgi:quercetin dioxygenase-like cupin family protein
VLAVVKKGQREMHVVRLGDASPYDAPRHHGMSTLRLHGAPVTPASAFTVGLSQALPGGGAELGASPKERVYVVLEGQLDITVDGERSTLGPLDSCLIAAGEERLMENRTNRTATFLVVMSQTDARSDR